MATDESYTDASGQRQDKPTWHQIVIWEKLAETCKRFIGKGSLVYVEGRLTYREWEDRNGGKRFTAEVIANTVKFLNRVEREPGSDQGHNSDPGHAHEQFQQVGAPQQAKPTSQAQQPPGGLPEELPF